MSEIAAPEIVGLCAAHRLPPLGIRQMDSLNRMLPGLRLVPDRYVGGLLRYLLCGVPPGSFLSAVLMNDLREAVRKCDDAGLDPIRRVVHFLWEHAPAQSWGSQPFYAAWINAGGWFPDTPAAVPLSRALAEAAGGA